MSRFRDALKGGAMGTVVGLVVIVWLVVMAALVTVALNILRTGRFTC